MAKSSKKSKEIAAVENTPVAAMTEAQNGNGTAKPAKKTAAKNAAPKSVKSAEGAKPSAKARATTPRKTALARKPHAAVSPRRHLGESKVLISDDEIRIRAYFIAEQRMREGRPGSSDNDWLEARRQLKDEAAQRA